MFFNPRFKLTYPKTDLDEHTLLFAINTVRFFSLGLIGIYIPIYIWGITHSLSWVLLFFGLLSATIALFLITIGNFIFSNFSLKNLIGVSFVLIMVKSYVLYLCAQSIQLIPYAAILAGIVTVTYWVPYHTIFIRKFKEKAVHFGKESSERDVLQKIGSALAPFIGGLIIAEYGFPALFGLSVVLYIVAAVPVMYLKDIKPLNKHNLIDMLRRRKEHKNITIGFIGEGLDAGVHSVFWPLLLFFALENFIDLGTINSVAIFLSLITTALAGKLVDKNNSRTVSRFGVVGLAITYVPMIVSRVPAVLYTNEVVDKLIAPFYTTPLMASVYEKAVQHNELDFMIYREFVLHGTIALMCFLLMGLSSDISAWQWVFGLGTFGVLLSRRITD